VFDKILGTFFSNSISILLFFEPTDSSKEKWIRKGVECVFYYNIESEGEPLLKAMSHTLLHGRWTGY
jgi:hypothetical protein